MLIMSLSRLLLLFSGYIVYFTETKASSHWMVTESGLIQPRLDSPFDMGRPHDLLAFLNQEKRWGEIFDLFHDLTKRQTAIDKLWTEVGKYTDGGRKIAQGGDCSKAGNVNTIDWYAGLLEDGSRKIHLDEFQLPSLYYGPNNEVPDCKRISSLTFSMLAFEHLESILQRENLSVNPEYVLPEMVSPIMTVDQYGHWLANILRHNTSSWLHYNMASLYWRVRGNAQKAIECSRRALHYVPREYKDVALGSLGVVLHRSGNTKDAIVVLTAAVEHDRSNYVSHFSIANAYSVMGEYNKSLNFFDLTIKLNPRMELAKKYKYGVLCHAKLAQRLRVIRIVLNKLRKELKQYHRKENTWQRLQAEILRTIKSAEEYEYRNEEKNNDRLSAITGLDVKKLKVHIEKNSLIKYFIDNFPMYKDEKPGSKGTDVVDAMLGLERRVQHVNRKENIPHATTQDDKLEDIHFFEIKYKNKHFQDSFPGMKLPNEKKQPPSSVTDETVSEYETGIFIYPSTMTVNRNKADFDTELEWPSNKMCTETAANFPTNVEAIFPVFLPFENKGVRMKFLLSEKLEVPLKDEYELPWHPPTCPHEKEAAAYTSKKSKNNLVSEVVDTGYLRLKLLEYVSDGNVDSASHMQEAEIGQRIYAAMKKKLAPKWILFTLSSLYWRVRSNNANALHCLMAAARWVPPAYRDLVLVSMGSLYLEMGFFDEAMAAAEESFRISLYEPATNFLLAELNMLKKHRNTHMYHLKQVVRVEEGFMNGLARNLLYGWACILKQVSALREMDLGEGDICTHVKPLVNMMCENDGENCPMSNIQCFSSQERTDTSALVRLLQEKQGIQSPDRADSTFFDRFIAKTPSDKADRLAHHAHYGALLRTMDTVLRGCGASGCNSMTPEDLAMTEEDCNFHHLQLGYWLHTVSFRQLLTESDVEVPSEITAMTPSSRKIPECRLTVDPMDDFFLEKLSRISTEGWGPVLSLMHQFAEMFDFDYVTLGAKVAKYVEARPSSWWGALAAGWWCGAGGRGACALRCLSAAHALAPPHRRAHALRAAVALLHMQSKQDDAKDVSVLSFYLSPKSKIEALIMGVSNTYLAEYDQAIWMYRYALSFDGNFLPAKACLHATMCLMLYGENKMKKEELFD